MLAAEYNRRNSVTDSPGGGVPGDKPWGDTISSNFVNKLMTKPI
jgi:hypothetical protein